MSEAPAEPRRPAGRRASSGITYARARLRLGIACVGSIVVLAAVLVGSGAPSALVPTSTSWAWSDPAWVALLVALYAALSAPFDVYGGLLLPRRFARPSGARGFARTWARGVVVHGFALIAVALALLAAGRAWGDGAALAAAGLLMFAMLAWQARIAGLVGGVRRVGDRLRASDPSFVGGIVGVPGRDRVLLSAAWDERTAGVQATRREAVRGTGSRALGAGLAVAFDLGGLAVVLSTTSASATSVAGLATASLWMTLWSFVGLLVLPTLSRRAVVAADRAALAAGIGRDALVTTLRRLDADQEDEPRRSRLVEAVFHPVPSLERRIAVVESGEGPVLPQPWHTARAALVLSWACLGLLSRAVHCNCGRPELWVLLPGD